MAEAIRAGGVLLSIRADVAQFSGSMRRMGNDIRRQERAMRGLRRTVQRAARQMQSFRRKVISVQAAVGVVSGAAGLGLMIRRSAELGSTLVETSQRLGLTVRDLQALQRAFESEGVSVQAVNTGLQRFTRRLADAANGQGQLQEAFRALEAPLRDANGRLRDSHDVLLDVAEGFKNTGDQQERVRLAQKLFDSEGVAFVNVLQRGREGLLELEKGFERLGFVESREAARLKALGQSFADLDHAVRAGAARAVAAAAVDLASLNERAGELAATLAGRAIAAVAHLARNLDAAKQAAIAFGLALGAMKIGAWVGTVRAAIAASAGLAAALRGLNIAVAAFGGPAGWIVAAVGALGYYFLSAKDSRNETDELVASIREAEIVLAGMDASARKLGLERELEKAAEHAAELAREIAASLQKHDELMEAMKAGARGTVYFVGREGRIRAGLEADAARTAEEIERLQAELAAANGETRNARGGGGDEILPRVPHVPEDYFARYADAAERRIRLARQELALVGKTGEDLLQLQARHAVVNRLLDERAQLERRRERAAAEFRAAAEAGDQRALAAEREKIAELDREIAAIAKAEEGKESLVALEREALETAEQARDAAKEHAAANERATEAAEAQVRALETASAARADGRREHLKLVAAEDRELRSREESARATIARSAAGGDAESEGEAAARRSFEDQLRGLEARRVGLDIDLGGAADGDAVAEIDAQLAGVEVRIEELRNRDLGPLAARLDRVAGMERLAGTIEENSVAAAAQDAEARIAALSEANAAAFEAAIRRGADPERLALALGEYASEGSQRFRAASDEAFEGLKRDLAAKRHALLAAAEEFRRRARAAAGDERRNQLFENAAAAAAAAENLRTQLGDAPGLRAANRDRIEREARERLVDERFRRRQAIQRDLLALSESMSRTLSDGLARAVEQGGKLKDHFKEIGRTLLNMALRKLVIDKATSALSGALSGLFGGGGGGAAPGKAGGGPVEAGRIYRVGESGVELFRPAAAGSIVPNHRLRPLAGGSEAPAVTLNIRVESTDGPGVEAAIRRLRPLLASDAAELAKGAVRTDLARASGLRGTLRA